VALIVLVDRKELPMACVSSDVHWVKAVRIAVEYGVTDRLSPMAVRMSSAGVVHGAGHGVRTASGSRAGAGQVMLDVDPVTLLTYPNVCELCAASSELWAFCDWEFLVPFAEYAELSSPLVSWFSAPARELQKHAVDFVRLRGVLEGTVWEERYMRQLDCLVEHRELLRRQQIAYCALLVAVRKLQCVGGHPMLDGWAPQGTDGTFILPSPAAAALLSQMFDTTDEVPPASPQDAVRVLMSWIPDRSSVSVSGVEAAVAVVEDAFAASPVWCFVQRPSDAGRLLLWPHVVLADCAVMWVPPVVPCASYQMQTWAAEGPKLPTAEQLSCAGRLGADLVAAGSMSECRWADVVATAVALLPAASELPV
jgi:hypothetical protein